MSSSSPSSPRNVSQNRGSPSAASHSPGASSTAGSSLGFDEDNGRALISALCGLVERVGAFLTVRNLQVGTIPLCVQEQRHAGNPSGREGRRPREDVYRQPTPNSQPKTKPSDPSVARPAHPAPRPATPCATSNHSIFRLLTNPVPPPTTKFSTLDV